MIEWIALTNSSQLNAIKEASATVPQIIFKHSTTCSISSMAYNRFQRSTQFAKAQYYYLDLLQYRSISNEVATFFQVHHESPQVLLIYKGECIYSESHYGITMDEIIEQVNLAI